MTSSFLEHVNITVSNPAKTAKILCDLFGWHIRWQGDAIHEGKTIHVGSGVSYLALYSREKQQISSDVTYEVQGGLNHLAIVVDDLDDVEARVISAGFELYSQADYEPGKRFYFRDNDGIEFEVVSY